MFNLGIQELAVIFIIALLFIGPKQLPELAKSLGKMFRDFKRASNEITDSLQREARQVTEFKDDLEKDIKKDYSLLPDMDSVSKSHRGLDGPSDEEMDAEQRARELAREEEEKKSQATTTADNTTTGKPDDDRT